MKSEKGLENLRTPEFRKFVSEMSNLFRERFNFLGAFYPESLTLEDKEIWNKMKNKTITRKELLGWHNKFSGESEQHRVMFAAILNSEANKVFKEQEKTELRSFVDEIAQMQQEERDKGLTAHFTFPSAPFNPEDLTLEDKKIWDKVKSGSITWDDYRAYEAEISKAVADPKDRRAASRAVFKMFIANKATPVLSWRDSESI